MPPAADEKLRQQRIQNALSKLLELIVPEDETDEQKAINYKFACNVIQRYVAVLSLPRRIVLIHASKPRLVLTGPSMFPANAMQLSPQT